MTEFERFLLEKGYIKFILDCKTGKYEIAKGHTISTLVNLDHRYFHNTDKIILEKITKGETVFNTYSSENELISKAGISIEDRKGEIIFGLHEFKKPPTLVFPRPKIEITRLDEKGKKIIKTDIYDDSMNIVLSNIDFEEIFKAMYDKNICIKIDLTLNK